MIRRRASAPVLLTLPLVAAAACATYRGTQPSPSADDTVLRHLATLVSGDATEETRDAAVFEVTYLGSDAVPPLVASLDDPALAPHAVELLGRIGPPAEPAVPRLAAMVRRREHCVAATDALIDIGGPAVERAAVDLTGDDDLDAALDGVRILGRVANPSADALAALSRAGRSRRPELRDTALRLYALAKADSAPEPRQESPPHVRSELEIALDAPAGSLDLDVVRRAFADVGTTALRLRVIFLRPGSRHAAAISALPEFRDAFHRLLDSPEARDRKTALSLAEFAGRNAPPELIPRIVAALEDGESWIRTSAIETLAAVSNDALRASVPRLRQLREDRTGPESLRFAAATQLLAIGDTGALERLLSADFCPGSWRARMSLLPDPKRLTESDWAAIDASLMQTEPWVLLALIPTTGWRAEMPPAVRERLVELTRHGVPAVRWAAAEALRRR